MPESLMQGQLRNDARGFVPSSRSTTRSDIGSSSATDNRSSKLSLAAVNAAPFVPSNKAKSGKSEGNASESSKHRLPVSGSDTRHEATGQAAAWSLPDGDDLLGLSSHTPGQTPATPVQDGRLDRSGLNAAAVQSAPHSPGWSYPERQGQQQGTAGHGRAAGGRGRQGPSGSPARVVSSPGPDRSPPSYGRGAQAYGRRLGFGSGEGGAAGSFGMLPLQGQQMQMRYMADQLRKELQQRSFLTHAQGERRPEEFGLPDMVQQYHSLFPLEDLQAAAEQPSAAFGVCSMLIRAIAPQMQGQAVTLRRLDARQVAPTQALHLAAQAAVEQWGPLTYHPGLLTPRSCFVTDEIAAQPALFFVHEHLPGAASLQQAHIQPQAAHAGLQRAPATEQQLWAYLTQLAAAIRAVHAAGLAVGAAALMPSKVLLASRATSRIRIGSLGIAQCLRSQRGQQQDVSAQQQEDIAAVAPLIFRVAGGSSGAPHLAALSSHVSPHLLHVLASLQNNHVRDCQTLCSAVNERALAVVEEQMLQQDALMTQLAQEFDNGRLLRLLARLVMVSEGSQTSLDPSWSETGDRYVIKLFKDFVFHQVNDSGGPLVDWGHVIEALNKLDLGLPEKVMLLSRDEMSMLLVSYGDVKQCIDTAYKELEAGAGRRHM